MDRVTRIYGTNEVGRLLTLMESEEINDFFRKLNAGITTKAFDLVVESLHSFKQLEGYDEETLDTKPVAVSYAPMYLRKVAPKEQPNIEPFCAMVVSGAENREDRNSEYYNAILWKKEDMTQSNDWNYLDLIFGPFIRRGYRWLSCTDIRSLRETISGKRDNDLQELLQQECELCLPAKVSIPTMTDRQAAISTVAAIYEGKNVILKTEKRYGFNRRAVELLIQIYSLMQPWLAAEIGFAAYQSPDGIYRRSKNTSIRIFVVPAGTNVEATEESVVIDLDGRISTSKNKDLVSVLDFWSQLDWETERCPAMQQLFAGIDFKDLAAFVEKSKDFIKRARALYAWGEDASKKGTVKDLNELRKEYEAHAEWWPIPWAEDTFKHRIPTLLGGVNLPELTADLTADCYIAARDGNGVDEQTFNNFNFGMKYSTPDVKRMCDRIWGEQETRCEKQIESLKVEFRDELDEKDKQHAAALYKKDEQIVAEKQAHLDLRTQLEEKCSDLSAKLKDEVEAHTQTKTEKANLAKELDAKTGEWARAVAEMQTAKHNLKVECESHAATKTQLTNERRAHEETEGELQRVSDDLNRAKRELKSMSAAKGKSVEGSCDGYDSGSPAFIRNMPWWLPLTICFVVGALLVGLVWGGIALFSGGSEEAPEISTTAAPTATEAPTTTETTATATTTEPITEASTEPPTEPESTIDADFVYDNWTAKETLVQLKRAVPQIQVAENTYIQEYVPTNLAATPLVVFTTDDQLPSVRDTTTSDFGTQLSMTKYSDGGYAILLETSEKMKNLEAFANADLIMQNGNKLLLVSGDYDLIMASARVFNLVVPVLEVGVESETTENGDYPVSAVGTTELAPNDAPTDEYGIDVQDNSSSEKPETKILLFFEDVTLDLSTFGEETDADWWRSIEAWTDRTSELSEYKRMLNTSPLPIMAIKSSSLDVVVYRYDPADNKADVLAATQNEAPNSAEAYENYVIICVRSTP